MSSRCGGIDGGWWVVGGGWLAVGGRRAGGCLQRFRFRFRFSVSALLVVGDRVGRSKNRLRDGAVAKLRLLELTR